MWPAVATSASPPQLYVSWRGRRRIAVAVSNIAVQQRICRAATLAVVVSMDRNPPLPIPKDPFPAAVTVDSGEWWVRAACRGADLSVFFSPDGERRSARDRREARARQICQVCPVLVRCRDHALTVGESYGVWGGMTEADRRKHTLRSRRGERRPLGSFHERPVGAALGVRRAAFTVSFDRAYTGGASRGRPTAG
ncbi:transcription factor WhiB [Rhodococcus wratislaviensis IFP 2016]|nr:transcription factor WhiB [Rhodococcus wratislaviensis IFP 2016]